MTNCGSQKSLQPKCQSTVNFIPVDQTVDFPEEISDDSVKSSSVGHTLTKWVQLEVFLFLACKEQSFALSSASRGPRIADERPVKSNCSWLKCALHKNAGVKIKHCSSIEKDGRTVTTWHQLMHCLKLVSRMV